MYRNCCVIQGVCDIGIKAAIKHDLFYFLGEVNTAICDTLLHVCMNFCVLVKASVHTSVTVWPSARTITENTPEPLSQGKTQADVSSRKGGRGAIYDGHVDVFSGN